MSARKLDNYDLAILDVLQKDGRITKSALANAIGLSTTPCWERLRKLERDDVIRSYRAEIDIKRIVHVEYFIVDITLKHHQSENFERFESAVQLTPEIISCDAVGGGVDYIMTVVANNIEHYQSLIEKLLNANLGIARYFTYAVTKEVKRGQGLPIETLLAGKNL